MPTSNINEKLLGSAVILGKA